MTEIQTNFRSNPSKCAFNNYGFCKFKLECRKQHAQNVCENQNCDKKCVNRHPKSCRNKDKCKFLKLNTCAFNHEALEKVNDEVCGQAKIDSDGIGELKRLVSENKEHFESRIKSLTDAVNNEIKKTDGKSTIRTVIEKTLHTKRQMPDKTYYYRVFSKATSSAYQ